MIILNIWKNKKCSKPPISISLLHYSTSNYTNQTTPQVQLQLQLHYTTNHTTLEQQLHSLHCSCGEVTTATIGTIPKNTTPTTFRSISGFDLPSVMHSTEPLLYSCPIFETSATALYGTGMWCGHRHQ